MIVDNSGHMIPMEQPVVLAQAIKSWLRTSVDSSSPKMSPRASTHVAAFHTRKVNLDHRLFQRLGAKYFRPSSNLGCEL